MEEKNYSDKKEEKIKEEPIKEEDKTGEDKQPDPNLRVGDAGRPYIAYKNKDLHDELEQLRTLFNRNGDDIFKKKITQIEEELLHRKNYGG